MCSDQDTHGPGVDHEKRSIVSLIHVLTLLLISWAAVVLSLVLFDRLSCLGQRPVRLSDSCQGFRFTLDQRLDFFVVIELHIVFVSFEKLFALVPLFPSLLNASSGNSESCSCVDPSSSTSLRSKRFVFPSLRSWLLRLPSWLLFCFCRASRAGPNQHLSIVISVLARG